MLSSPATIWQWLKQPKDRTVKAGDTGKTLEFEFDVNFPDNKNQDPADFKLNVTFEQGCAFPCKGDFEPDGDVDGFDLANQAGIDISVANANTEVSLEDFAENFGRDDCPK